MTKILILIFITIISFSIYLPIVHGNDGTIPEMRLGGSYETFGVRVDETPITVLQMPSARAYKLRGIAVNIEGVVIFIDRDLLSGESYIINSTILVRLNAGVLQMRSLSGTWTVTLSILWV